MKKRLEKKISKLKQLKRSLYFKQKAENAINAEDCMMFSSLSLTPRERANAIDIVIERTTELLKKGQKSRGVV